MTPVGVTEDPRQVLMMGDEPDTASELLALAVEYAKATRRNDLALMGSAYGRLESAIRAALEVQP